MTTPGAGLGRIGGSTVAKGAAAGGSRATAAGSPSILRAVAGLRAASRSGATD